MANRSNNQGNLYKPYAKKKPSGHSKVVGQGTVSVQKGEKATDGWRVAPERAINTSYYPAGIDDQGKPRVGRYNDALVKSGIVKKPKPKPSGGGKSGNGGFGHR